MFYNKYIVRLSVSVGGKKGGGKIEGGERRGVKTKEGEERR